MPLAVPALDKPPVPLPAVPLPPAPQGMPELPPAPMVGHLGERPVAPLAPPRFLACNPVGSLLGVASELIECGRARYQRNELEEARAVLEKAVQSTSERAQIREARYWLGETLVRLNKPAEAERLMLQVQQDDPRGELGLYAAHQLGWISLELSKPDRALNYFDCPAQDPARRPPSSPTRATAAGSRSTGSSATRRRATPGSACSTRARRARWRGKAPSGSGTRSAASGITRARSSACRRSSPADRRC